jgi:hypothetical protein
MCVRNTKTHSCNHTFSSVKGCAIGNQDLGRKVEKCPNFKGQSEKINTICQDCVDKNNRKAQDKSQGKKWYAPLKKENWREY